VSQEEADRLEIKHAHNAAASQAAQEPRPRIFFIGPMPSTIDGQIVIRNARQCAVVYLDGEDPSGGGA